MGCLSTKDKIEPEPNEVEKGSRSPGTKSTTSLVSDQFSTKNRSCTDVIFIFIMAAFLISLLGLIIYCASNGDIYRIVNGYDACGNICGRMNEKNEDFPVCTGRDHRDQTFLLIRSSGRVDFFEGNVHRQCVSECPEAEGFKTLWNRCVPELSKEVANNLLSKTGITDFLQEVSEDLQFCWPEILYMCLLALLFSGIIVALLRFVAGFVIWIILITASLASFIGTVYLWVLWSEKKSERKRQLESETEADQSDVTKRTVMVYLMFAIVATIVTIVVLLVILVMRKRIQLVVQLFQEAGKAVSSMPLLLFEPILTFLSLAFIVSLWILCVVTIESSGFLGARPGVENFEFRKDDTMKFTRWYNLLALFWLAQFVLGCQQMVIAGAVSKWFFTRNKDNLGYPMANAFKTLTRYHLGTVAFGSLIIAIVQLIRSIIAAVEGYTKNSENSLTKCLFKTCHCCLYCLDKVLQFITRNAYIVTAIHGYPFCQAGKQAFKLLASNALRVAAINSVGDFVLILAKLLVVVATCLCGFAMLKDYEGVQHMWVPIMLGGLFAFFVVHAFVSVYEMIIDTIFICFCEDCEQNDGLSRPYFMSRGLMEFVENSKKALAILDSKDKDYSGTTTLSMK